MDLSHFVIFPSLFVIIFFVSFQSYNYITISIKKKKIICLVAPLNTFFYNTSLSFWITVKDNKTIFLKAKNEQANSSL